MREKPKESDSSLTGVFSLSAVNAKRPITVLGSLNVLGALKRNSSRRHVICCNGAKLINPCRASYHYLVPQDAKN